jgi:DegV family protein with EDD domain
MTKIALVTDSTAYIPQNLLDQYHITVAPQILIWGDENFEDGVDIQPPEFFTRLKKASVMPTSSQVPPAKFKKIFDDLLSKDYQILAILISSKLSGTIASALQARDLFPNAPIEIVDSNSTAMAMGFQVLQVARAAESGASLAECRALAERSREHTGLFVTVNTLEFLHRGGRIGGGARFLGTALNIKPILELCDGRLEAAERVRTRRKALTRLIELAEDRIAGRAPVRLACLHANAAEAAQSVLDQAKVQFNAVEGVLAYVSPVIGTHVGPGTVAFAFMAGM